MSKRKIKSLVYSILTVVAAGIVYLVTIYTGGDIPGSNTITQDNNSKAKTSKENTDETTLLDTAHFEEAVVKRIVDGDTIIVNINGKDEKVRFIGMNCPENTSKVEYFGKEATEYTKKSLLGKTVYLEKDVNNTDKYGRLLRYVWLEIPTNTSKNELRQKMFNAILLKDGYAQIATYPPDVKYVNIFKEIAKEARENNLGLYKK